MVTDQTSVIDRSSLALDMLSKIFSLASVATFRKCFNSCSCWFPHVPLPQAQGSKLKLWILKSSSYGGMCKVRHFSLASVWHVRRSPCSSVNNKNGWSSSHGPAPTDQISLSLSVMLITLCDGSHVYPLCVVMLKLSNNHALLPWGSLNDILKITL